MANFYDFSVTTAKGEEIKMVDFKGKVVLIVNTATGCGFTPQYDGLQNLYEKYKNKGFEILDFPCNQFGNQAPGSDEEIASFCNAKFGITFRQFSKIDVNGENEEPLYKFLKSQKGGIFNENIKWNFTKFLVDRDGNVIGRFAPTDTPKSMEEKIKEAIEK